MRACVRACVPACVSFVVCVLCVCEDKLTVGAFNQRKTETNTHTNTHTHTHARTRTHTHTQDTEFRPTHETEDARSMGRAPDAPDQTIIDLAEQGLTCPLTLAPALNPATPGDGFIYELEALQRYMSLYEAPISPMTRAPLSGEITVLKCLTDVSRALARKNQMNDDVEHQERIEKRCKRALDCDNRTQKFKRGQTDRFFRRAHGKNDSERQLRLSTLFRLTLGSSGTRDRLWHDLANDTM